jgi:hypothetical protein
VTALAEECLCFALRHLQSWMQLTYGTPQGEHGGRTKELVVIGMGKLGGEELNVSSDIDLVFLYPEDGKTQGPRPIHNQEYFDRLARRLIGALSEYTTDGWVPCRCGRVPTAIAGAQHSYDMLENISRRRADWGACPGQGTGSEQTQDAELRS